MGANGGGLFPFCIHSPKFTCVEQVKLSSCSESAQHLGQGEEPLSQAIVRVMELLFANLFSGMKLSISAWEAALVRTGGFLLHIHFFFLLRVFAVLSKGFCPLGMYPGTMVWVAAASCCLSVG